MTVDESKRYPYFGVPPPNQPKPAAEVPALRGKGVVLSMPDGFVYDMRAVTQIYKNDDGRDVIDIVSEGQYYRWMFTGQQPERSPFPVRLVWVE